MKYHHNPQKSISLLLCALIAGAVLSCGDSNPVQPGESETETETQTTAETTGEPKIEYIPAKTYEGEEVVFLNVEDMYNMRSQMDREKPTGEPLDDAMYERCRTVEEKLNITLKEELGGLEGGLADLVRKAVRAGDDVYDIAYITAREMNAFIRGEYVYDLLDFEQLQLDQPWWSQSYNDSTTINGHLYAAVGASQLMYIDSLWCLYFNENMMTNLDMTYPYDLVREGKWTIDRLAEYMRDGAQINADNTFDWDPSGTCVYGLSGAGADKFLAGCGEFLIENIDGVLTLSAETQRFGDVASALSELLVKNGGNRSYVEPQVADGNIGNYLMTFETERCLFVTAELSKTARMRDKDFSYGIVPFPKYDETQEHYYAVPFYATPGFTIPVTVADPERSAIVGDALSFYGNEIVLPIFRENTLEQKGLRNDDSIEMLDLIIRSSRADLCYIFNVGIAMRNNVGSAILEGQGVASTVASYKKKTLDQIAKYYED